MIRFSPFLAIAGILNPLRALSQDFGAILPEKIDDRFSGSTLNQPLPLDSELNTYDAGGIAAQPPPLFSADLEISPDNAYLASLFSNEDDLNTSGDSPFSPFLLASSEMDPVNADLNPGYDESLIAYEKAPLYDWPSDQNKVVFPFNCWKDNRDGFVCKEDQCQMGKIFSFLSHVELIETD